MKLFSKDEGIEIPKKNSKPIKTPLGRPQPPFKFEDEEEELASEPSHNSSCTKEEGNYAFTYT